METVPVALELYVLQKKFSILDLEHKNVYGTIW